MSSIIAADAADNAWTEVGPCERYIWDLALMHRVPGPNAVLAPSSFAPPSSIDRAILYSSGRVGKAQCAHHAIHAGWCGGHGALHLCCFKQWRRRLCPSYASVIVRGRYSIPETSVIEPMGRGVLDSPPSRGMTAESGVAALPTSRDAPSRPRGAIRVRAVDHVSLSAGRGRRECRALASPMARLQKKSRRQSPQVQPNIRHSPRDGFTDYT
jgi:hypothetical protein